MEWKTWKYKKSEVGKVLPSFGNPFLLVFLFTENTGLETLFWHSCRTCKRHSKITKTLSPVMKSYWKFWRPWESIFVLFCLFVWCYCCWVFCFVLFLVLFCSNSYFRKVNKEKQIRAMSAVMGLYNIHVVSTL